MQPRTRWILICLGCFALGAIIGHRSAPTKTVTEYRANVVQDIRAQERVRELEQELENYKRHTKKETVIVYRGGKPAEKRVTEDTHVDKVMDTRRDVDAVRTEHTTTERAVTQTVTVEADRPDWRVSLIGGADVSHFTPTYGVMVERRVLGPFSAGVWALPMSKSAGVTLSVEF